MESLSHNELTWCWTKNVKETFIWPLCLEWMWNHRSIVVYNSSGYSFNQQHISKELHEKVFLTFTSRHCRQRGTWLWLKILAKIWVTLYFIRHSLGQVHVHIGPLRWLTPELRQTITQLALRVTIMLQNCLWRRQPTNLFLIGGFVVLAMFYIWMDSAANQYLSITRNNMPLQ